LCKSVTLRKAEYWNTGKRKGRKNEGRKKELTRGSWKK
jgi:hypothetical protein